MAHINTEKLLHAAWYTPGLNKRWGLPMLFEGAPGVGKSRMIEDAAAASGLVARTVIASIAEPADFSGMPMPYDCPTTGARLVRYAPPSWVHDLLHGVVFFDEITTCAPAVQAALLRVILDGRVGDFVLPSTVRFVAACNPVEIAAGGWDLAAPLANRFGHRTWEAPDAEAWGDWLLGVGSDAGAVVVAEDEQARVLRAWDSAFASAKGLFSSFIRARPELLNKRPKAGDPALSRAWSSPRTNEMAVRASAGAAVHGFTDVEHDEFVSSFIGAAATGELRTFIDENDLPKPLDVLDGVVSFEHNVRRLDRTFAVFGSCAAFLANADKKSEQTKKRVEVMWDLLHSVIGTASDVAVPAAKVMVRSGHIGRGKAAIKALAALSPILEAAGLRAR